MPKKWRNNWVFTGDKAAADFRDRKLLTLGNLTIITQALNASIRDSDWATKKNGKGDKGGQKNMRKESKSSPLILTQMLGMKMQFRIERLTYRIKHLKHGHLDLA